MMEHQTSKQQFPGLNEDRYREIVESADEGIWVIDAEARTSLVNPRLAEMLGYTVAEMIGRSLSDFMDEPTRRIAAEQLDRRRIGIRERHEFKFRHRNGTDVWTSLATSPLYDRQGRYGGALALVTDITAHRRTELALQRSEERLALAISASSQGLWDWDIRADRAYLSPEYLALLDDPSNTEVAPALDWFYRTVHPDDLPAVEHTIREHLEGKTPQSVVEYRVKKPSGEFVWIAGVGRVVERAENGAPLRMIGVIADITERKQLERALRAALRSRENLLAVVSHDLRNPLAAIRLSGGLLARRLPPSERERSARQIEILLQSAETMRRLIDDLLQSETIESGTFTVELSDEDPVAIAGEAILALELLADAKSIALRLDVQPRLPTVRCDRERIAQVFSNLIGNAIKFEREDGAITIRASERDGEVVFAVSDHGPGIADEQQAHLFDRFWKGAGRSGVGLGLFIAKSIVEAHGGRIWVNSRLGEGSTFAFSIPAAHGPMRKSGTTT
jgi:PAS domain S-box-containing protein